MKGPILSSPTFLSITIGIPFCIYKVLFGILAIRIGLMIGNTILVFTGFLIIIWASVDFLMNTARAVFDIFNKSSLIEYCTLAQIGRICGASTLFLALDTLITFLIICFVLWSGWIIYLTEQESFFWYFATTLNLISISFVGLWNEIIRFRM